MQITIEKSEELVNFHQSSSPATPPQSGASTRFTPPMVRGRVGREKFWAIVLAGIGVYVALLCWACHTKFNNFRYDDFDLAIDAQSTWNILHGSIFSSIHGIPFLGNHMRLILFLIAPIYALFESPLLLLYLQTFALGAAAWGIYLLAKRELQERWGVFFSLIYLVYPPLIYLNLYEFHPVAFVVPFFIYMFYFYKTGSFGLYTLFLLLAMACQENIPLIAIFFAVYAFIDGKRGLWVFVPLITGLVYFYLSVFILMPHFNRGTIQFYNLYGNFGESILEILKNIIIHPVKAARIMFSSEKLSFLSSLLAPLGYLSVLSPLDLLPALPVLFQRLLSLRPSESTIVYHYQAEFIPFIFIAAIFAIRKVLGFKRLITKRALTIILIFFPLVSILASGVVVRIVDDIKSGVGENFLNSRKDMLLSKIADDASVMATFEFLPGLSNRKELYSLHHAYSGRYTLSGVLYPVPQSLDYIILNTNDRLTFSTEGFYGRENYRRLQAILNSRDWEVMEHIESLLVFKREPGSVAEPLNLVEYIDESIEMNRNVVQVSDGTIRLMGFEIGRRDKENTVLLTLFWEKPVESMQDYDVLLIVTDGQVLYYGVLAPGHRIFPPQSWPTGRVIADRHRIHLETGEVSSDDIEVRVEMLPLK